MNLRPPRGTGVPFPAGAPRKFGSIDAVVYTLAIAMSNSCAISCAAVHGR